MAEATDLDLPWTRVRAASRLRELLICGVLGPLMDLYTCRRMERVRVFLNEFGPDPEREPETEYAHRRQPV